MKKKDCFSPFVIVIILCSCIFLVNNVSFNDHINKYFEFKNNYCLDYDTGIFKDNNKCFVAELLVTFISSVTYLFYYISPFYPFVLVLYLLNICCRYTYKKMWNPR